MIAFGCDPEWLFDLDMLSFEALAQSMARIKAQDNYSDFTEAALAAQGDEKGIKKHSKALKKDMRSLSDPDREPDLQDLKGGI